jgi:beta-N-acetylhexosaminidase
VPVLGLAVLLAAATSAAGTSEAVESLTPRERAALVVVSSPPAPPGVAGVLLHRWETGDRVPGRALVFVDQEGGPVRAYPSLPPARAAASYATVEQARRAGRATGRALGSVGVDVDLAPVLDAAVGPLGSRHFRRPALGLAFARGLGLGGIAGCAKHFPGLGSTPVTTDNGLPVRGVVREREVRAFRAAIRAGVPCVMVSHAIYRRFGDSAASLEPRAYRLVRSLGFRGVAITDELGVLGGEARLAVRAIRAGADLVLFSSPAAARRAIEALVPLARRGLLDTHVARVLRFRDRFGR